MMWGFWMKILLKKTFIFLIGLLLIFIFTGLIVRGIHYVVFQSGKYISFASPIIHLAKYFAVAMVVFMMINRLFTLTKAGKIIIPLLMIISIAGLLVSSLWFNAANEEQITKFRVIYPVNYSWEEVDYITTEIYREDRIRTIGGSRMKPRKVIAKYNIHLTDGSSINVWSNLSAVYSLHQLVMEKEIDVKYLTESEYFDQRFKNYFREELSMAHVVFGIEE